jgi:phosphoribosylpyrophosphate synthetase
MRLAAAARITAIIPYFGYARADKRHGRSEPITASVAAVIEAVGVDHVMTIDLHAPQIEGFFHIPVDSLTAVGLLAESVSTLMAAGARPEIFVAATHGLLLDGARERLSHPAVKRVFVTDTIAQANPSWPLLQIVSVAPLIADALQRARAPTRSR